MTYVCGWLLTFIFIVFFQLGIFLDIVVCLAKQDSGLLKKNYWNASFQSKKAYTDCNLPILFASK